MTYWTSADAAELDVLVHELVSGYLNHREGCRQPICLHLAVALSAIVDWRRRRELVSIAARLRATQEISEWGEAA